MGGGGAALKFIGALMAPLGRLWLLILEPTGSRRVNLLCVSDVFGATAKNRKN